METKTIAIIGSSALVVISIVVVYQFAEEQLAKKAISDSIAEAEKKKQREEGYRLARDNYLKNPTYDNCIAVLESETDPEVISLIGQDKVDQLNQDTCKNMTKTSG